MEAELFERLKRLEERVTKLEMPRGGVVGDMASEAVLPAKRDEQGNLVLNFRGSEPGTTARLLAGLWHSIER